MALSKAFKFKPELYHFSLICKALSHPARVQIIRNISETNGTYYKFMIKGIPLSQSAIAQHIKILREMNLLLVETRHPNTYYKINNRLSNTGFDLIKLALNADVKPSEQFHDEIKFIERRQGVIEETVTT